jgi:hypothetical protein
MAISPAHQFGQEIGLLLEEIIKPLLSDFTSARNLYLDTKGPRGKARSGNKVTWADKYNNLHDLDFVIERDGTTDQRGRPLAFIESAWRRYTKHSRNKAQEIQGAILPIVEQYAWDAPFKGVIFAGIFTTGAITQLESSGFVVLYIDYASMVRAFAVVEIDIAFDEETPDSAFSRALRLLKRLKPIQREYLKFSLRDANQAKIETFIARLADTLARVVERITILPLYGTTAHAFARIDQAISFLEQPIQSPSTPLIRPTKIEVNIRFSDGTHIEASFLDAARALDFIRYATKT